MSTTEKKHLNQSGQSTVEFALVIIFLMSFVLFFFQLSLIFAVGSYTHYATFMAARAYLAAGPDEQDQRDRAKSYIAQMLKKSEFQSGSDRFPSVAQSYGGGGELTGLDFNASQYDPDNKDLVWLQGVRYSFRSRVFLVPFAAPSAASATPATANMLSLQSESWLLREPTFSECVEEMQKRDDRGFFDNGC